MYCRQTARYGRSRMLQRLLVLSGVLVRLLCSEDRHLAHYRLGIGAHDNGLLRLWSAGGLWK